VGTELLTYTPTGIRRQVDLPELHREIYGGTIGQHPSDAAKATHRLRPKILGSMIRSVLLKKNQTDRALMKANCG
jgi:hypothetical protein